jgi:hypothetical protein
VALVPVIKLLMQVAMVHQTQLTQQLMPAVVVAVRVALTHLLAVAPAAVAQAAQLAARALLVLRTPVVVAVAVVDMVQLRAPVVQAAKESSSSSSRLTQQHPQSRSRGQQQLRFRLQFFSLSLVTKQSLAQLCQLFLEQTLLSQIFLQSQELFKPIQQLAQSQQHQPQPQMVY